MANVPVICDACGAFFIAKSLFGGDLRHVTFSGSNKVGPCPGCGSVGRIPDGTYDFIGASIDLLSAPDRSIAELKTLARLLRSARDESVTPERVREEIRSELPGLSELLPRSRSELYACIAIILTIIAMLLKAGGNGQATHIEIDQVINNIEEQIIFPRGPQ